MKALILFAAVSLLAAPPIEGPVEGYVYDPPSRGFRPVLGMLGSAVLGPVRADGYDFGSVAPLKKHAFGWQNEQFFALKALFSTSPERVFVTDGPKPEHAAWSGDGSVAVVYASNWLQVIRGWPDAPEASPRIEVERIQAVAAGQRILVAAAGSLYEMADDANLTPVPLDLVPALLAIHKDLLYGVDLVSHQLFALNLSTRAVERWALDVEDPVSLHAGAGSVYIGSGKDRTVAVFDPASGAIVQKVEVPAVPSALNPLGLSSFLLAPRSAADDPLWSVASGPALQVRFVPAPAEVVE